MYSVEKSFVASSPYIQYWWLRQCHATDVIIPSEIPILLLLHRGLVEGLTPWGNSSAWIERYHQCNVAGIKQTLVLSPHPAVLIVLLRRRCVVILSHQWRALSTHPPPSTKRKEKIQHWIESSTSPSWCQHLVFFRLGILLSRTSIRIIIKEILIEGILLKNLIYSWS